MILESHSFLGSRPMLHSQRPVPSEPQLPSRPSASQLVPADARTRGFGTQTTHHVLLRANPLKGGDAELRGYSGEGPPCSPGRQRIRPALRDVLVALAVPSPADPGVCGREVAGRGAPEPTEHGNEDTHAWRPERFEARFAYFGRISAGELE
jgi:hypothetical protein